jgi:hypothetical protein
LTFRPDIACHRDFDPFLSVACGRVQSGSVAFVHTLRRFLRRFFNALPDGQREVRIVGVQVVPLGDADAVPDLTPSPKTGPGDMRESNRPGRPERIRDEDATER